MVVNRKHAEWFSPRMASFFLFWMGRRLSGGWLEVRGHRVLAGETFVVPAGFAGSSYKARRSIAELLRGIWSIPLDCLRCCAPSHGARCVESLELNVLHIQESTIYILFLQKPATSRVECQWAARSERASAWANSPDSTMDARLLHHAVGLDRND